MIHREDEAPAQVCTALRRLEDVATSVVETEAIEVLETVATRITSEETGTGTGIVIVIEKAIDARP